MSKTDTTAAARQAAHRRRRRDAGVIELRGVWVPAELVEQARKVVAELAERHKAPQKPAAPLRECKCDLRTKLVGDGCDVCNPEYAADHAAEEQK